MSTEPYPEVTGDESAIVPPQAMRAPEWPKKIRTLTASELDRLTIDSAGRFYWDSKLVNYNAAGGAIDADGKSAEATERSAMDIIDRAVHDLGDHNTPEPIEGAELPRRIRSPLHRDRDQAVDLDADRRSADVAQPYDAGPYAIGGVERVRVKLSRWQSFGAVIAVLGILVGAAGVAAYGWVSAHDWACRIGAISHPCPPLAAPRPPRADIPA